MGQREAGWLNRVALDREASELRPPGSVVLALAVEAAREGTPNYSTKAPARSLAPIPNGKWQFQPSFHHSVTSTPTMIRRAVIRQASSGSVAKEAVAAKRRQAQESRCSHSRPYPYRIHVRCSGNPATAAALVGHNKMRECPPSSSQPPYEADTESNGIPKLTPTCPSPLATPDINPSSPTINWNHEGVSLFRHRPMSTQTFPFDVFTSKGLVCIAYFSSLDIHYSRPKAETQTSSPTTWFYYFIHTC